MLPVDNDIERCERRKHFKNKLQQLTYNKGKKKILIFNIVDITRYLQSQKES